IRQDGANRILFAELAIHIALDLGKLALLQRWIEAEIGPGVELFANAGRLAPARFAELLENLRGPLDLIEHADGLLRVHDALRQPRNLLLVGPPRRLGRQQ